MEEQLTQRLKEKLLEQMENDKSIKEPNHPPPFVSRSDNNDHDDNDHDDKDISDYFTNKQQSSKDIAGHQQHPTAPSEATQTSHMIHVGISHMKENETDDAVLSDASIKVSSQ